MSECVQFRAKGVPWEGDCMADDPNANPSAAEVVLKGKVTEDTASELARLTEDRDKLSKTVREREMRISELEDQNRSLMAVPTKKDFLDHLADYFPKAS